MLCENCKERESIAKQLCNRCYYAKKRGYTIVKFQLEKRNFIRNGIGILSDEHGKEWEVDLDDFEKLKNDFWHCHNLGYAVNGKMQLLHKVICPQYSRVDHKDQNKHNNRKSNLRDGNQIIHGCRLNELNSTTKRGKTGIKGIHKYSRDNNWYVHVCKKRLGSFKKLDDAKKCLINYVIKNNLEEFYPINI